MTGRNKRVVFLSQLGIPGSYDPAIFRNAPGGDDEGHWLALQLDALGLLDRIDYSSRRVTHGGQPPEPEEADIVILGGSFHSVHDDLPYQRRMLDWFGRWRAADKPLFGICGGHQLISFWQGIPVEKIPEGPACATQSIRLTEAGKAHPLFAGLAGDDLHFHFGNFDRVTRLPEGAMLLADRPEMPAMAIDHGRHWWSVQFHPEADRAIFVMSWGKEAPGFGHNYRPVPKATQLLRNFLLSSGVPEA